MLEKEWIEVLIWCLTALLPLCLRCRCLGLISSSSGNVSTTFQLPAIASFVSSLVWIIDSILHGNASLPPWPPRPFLSFWSSGLHLRKIAITHQHLQPNNHHRTYASPSSSKTHTRPSSSAQPESSSTVPSTSSTAATSLAHDVNPPPSTRPADISTPEPVGPEASAADKLKRYVALGRAYLSFYKTGLKNVYHNHRASLPLRRALGLPMYLPVSPPPSPRKAAAVSAFRAAIQSDPEFSRSHFQLVRRAAYDVRRIVPFSLMLIICGEFTPLIVLAVGSAIVPFTCRVPKQFAKDRVQRASRKRAALVDHFVRTTGSMSVPGSSSSSGSGTAGKNYGPELDLVATQFANREWIETASSEEILRACAVMGLARTHRRSSALVSLVYKPRLQRFAEYLALDDGLIRRGGGVGAMEAVEVRMAVEERGGVELVMEMEDWEAEREQRRWLEAWLERREGLQL